MRRTTAVLTRILRGTDMTGRCWMWRGPVNAHGYGRISVSATGKHFYVHRLVYEMTFGALEPGQIVMHSCDTPGCVNPAHLHAGTQAENVADMCRKGRGTRARPASADKTSCVHGHAYTPENTHRTGAGWRQCRRCHREQERARKARLRGCQ